MVIKYACSCGRTGTQAALRRHVVACRAAGECYRSGGDPIQVYSPVKAEKDRGQEMVLRIIEGKAIHEERLARWSGFPDPLEDVEE